MKKLLIVPIALAMCACAHVHTRQVHETYGPNGQLLSRDTTTGGATTVLDSNNQLTKWTAHQSATNGQYNTVGGLNESSSGSNFVAGLTVIDDIVTKAAAASVK